jgi:hypothetical protein
MSSMKMDQSLIKAQLMALKVELGSSEGFYFLLRLPPPLK